MKAILLHLPHSRDCSTPAAKHVVERDRKAISRSRPSIMMLKTAAVFTLVIAYARRGTLIRESGNQHPWPDQKPKATERISNVRSYGMARAPDLRHLAQPSLIPERVPNLTQETFKPMPQNLSNGLASTGACLPVAGNNLLGGVARNCVVDT